MEENQNMMHKNEEEENEEVVEKIEEILKQNTGGRGGGLGGGEKRGGDGGERGVGEEEHSTGHLPNLQSPPSTYTLINSTYQAWHYIHLILGLHVPISPV